MDVDLRREIDCYRDRVERFEVLLKEVVEEKEKLKAEYDGLVKLVNKEVLHIMADSNEILKSFKVDFFKE